MGGIHVNTGPIPPRTVTLSASGVIDSATADQLRHALVDVIMHKRPRDLVVDLEDVTAVDSSVIGILQAAHHTAAAVGCALTFRTARSPLAAVFDQDGLGDDPHQAG